MCAYTFFLQSDNPKSGVDLLNGFGSDGTFGLTNVLRVEKELPVQIRLLDMIHISYSDAGTVTGVRVSINICVGDDSSGGRLRTRECLLCHGLHIRIVVTLGTHLECTKLIQSRISNENRLRTERSSPAGMHYGRSQLHKMSKSSVTETNV